MGNAGFAVSLKKERITEEDGTVHEVVAALDQDTHRSVVRGQVGSRHHRGEGPLDREAQFGKQGEEGGRSRPASASGAILQPGFEESGRVRPGERSGTPLAEMNELLDIVEGNPLAPGTIKFGQVLESRFGRTGKTEPGQHLLDKITGQGHGKGWRKNGERHRKFGDETGIVPRSIPLRK